MLSLSAGTKKKPLTPDYASRIMPMVTAQDVKKIRKRLSLTQAQLAERVGVTASSVARWEQGVMGIRESAARLLRLVAETETKGKRRKRR